MCVLASAAALAGCVSAGGPTPASNAFASADSNATTLAFESVDGPPPRVFERLVNALDNEAKLRGFPVVSREAPSAYRVRTYLSAQVRGSRTTIAWVLDVYDRNQQRALRLSGEETGSRRLADAWDAADDIMLRRIAQAGLTGLSGIISGPPQQTAPGIRQSGPVLADLAGSTALGFNAH